MRELTYAPAALGDRLMTPEMELAQEAAERPYAQHAGCKGGPDCQVCARFRCTRCQGLTPWCAGAADTRPYWCDPCWAEWQDSRARVERVRRIRQTYPGMSRGDAIRRSYSGLRTFIERGTWQE